MLVVFVHGWSVTNTNTYGGLPNALKTNALTSLNIQVEHLFLSKYVSFADEVKIDDIARGMENALNEVVLPKLRNGERFACITHSTGAPVVRTWISLKFRKKLSDCPISHLIMLAPANHGSALAQLGKGRLSRMKFFTEEVQPGVGVLDWLELGSDQSWDLNQQWLSYNCTGAGTYLFPLIGQKIDRAYYDHLNAYTDEAGSDGVVRVASANMNYGVIHFTQKGDELKLKKVKRSIKTAFGILPGRSHSGGGMGVMQSVQPNDDGSHPTLKSILRCLEVDSSESYNEAIEYFDTLSKKTQKKVDNKDTNKEFFLYKRTFITNRYCMLVFRIVDDCKNNLSDYDVIFTAGPDYDANHLPEGFFVDRQRNLLNHGKLTYYVDYDVLNKGLKSPGYNGKFGIKIIAHPKSGFAYYTVAKYEGNFSTFKKYIEPNQTLMIEVKMSRHVDEGVFEITQELVPEDIDREKKGNDIHRIKRH